MKCVVSIEKDRYQLRMIMWKIVRMICVIITNYNLSLIYYCLLYNGNGYVELLGVTPSRTDNMKSYLLDNADPIDRSYQSYSVNEAERQLPSVSTRPTNNKREPPRNIFSDL